MQRTPASGKGSAENRAAIPASKHPAEILALGPSCASHRRSLNANSLGGQNSAGSLEICAIFQWIICADVSEFESYMPSQPVPSLWVMCGTWENARQFGGLARY